MTEKDVAKDLICIIKKYVPEITKPLESFHPAETSVSYYDELISRLVGASGGLLLGEDEKEFLNYVNDLIPEQKREEVSPVLKRMINDLKNYKSTLAASDLNQLREKKDSYII